MVVELIIIIVLELLCLPFQGCLHSCISERRSRKSNASGRECEKLLGKTPSPTQNARTVIASSSVTFGNECDRLVDIAIRESQTCPSPIGARADISQYLRQHLIKKYPNVHFRIIVGGNEILGIFVGDSQHFAEIEQGQYRVLIFTN